MFLKIIQIIKCLIFNEYILNLKDLGIWIQNKSNIYYI